jgi:hypothetical protein
MKCHSEDFLGSHKSQGYSAFCLMQRAPVCCGFQSNTVAKDAGLAEKNNKELLF